MRSSCHGLAAASGKFGALVGSVGFFFASQPTAASGAKLAPGTT